MQPLEQTEFSHREKSTPSTDWSQLASPSFLVSQTGVGEAAGVSEGCTVGVLGILVAVGSVGAVVAVGLVSGVGVAESLVAAEQVQVELSLLPALQTRGLLSVLLQLSPGFLPWQFLADLLPQLPAVPPGSPGLVVGSVPPVQAEEL